MAQEFRCDFQTVSVAALAMVVVRDANVELLQFWGIPLFGSTWDPLDLVAYAVGTGLGVLIDEVLMRKAIRRWDPTWR